MRKKNRCFSLIELMVVIGIIGALSAILVRGVLRHNEVARYEISLAALDEISQALKFYKLQHRRYPESLEVLREGGEMAILEKDPIDGWGNPLQYQYPSENSERPYDLISLGSDGEWGGEGFDADLHLGRENPLP